MQHVIRFALAAVLVSLSACSVYRCGDKVVKLHDYDQCASVEAPRSGTYAVAYRDRGSGEFWPAVHQHLRVKEGDPVGFRRDESTGHLIAFAGDNQRKLGKLPVTAQYVCWYRLSDTTLRARKFGDDVREAAVGTAKVAGAAALVAGAVIGEAYLESLDEDDECDEDDRDDYYRIRLEKRKSENRSKYRRRD